MADAEPGASVHRHCQPAAVPRPFARWMGVQSNCCLWRAVSWTPGPCSAWCPSASSAHAWPAWNCSRPLPRAAWPCPPPLRCSLPQHWPAPSGHVCPGPSEWSPWCGAAAHCGRWHLDPSPNCPCAERVRSCPACGSSPVSESPGASRRGQCRVPTTQEAASREPARHGAGGRGQDGARLGTGGAKASCVAMAALPEAPVGPVLARLPALVAEALTQWSENFTFPRK